MQIEKIPRRSLSRKKIVDRDSYILESCRGKRVLHLGCTDAPLTRRKYELGSLLHLKLEGIASTLVGADIDAESVQWLEAKGIKNLHLADAAGIEMLLDSIGFRPEVIVAGEILEHLSSPLDFLGGVRRGMGDSAKLLISVPNAFWFEGFIHVLLGTEKVHPEHVAYYSYYTVKQLLERAGLDVQDCRPCSYQLSTWKKALTDSLQKPIMWLSPHFAAGYVLTATVAEGKSGKA
jgi:methyltransferase family protein